MSDVVYLLLAIVFEVAGTCMMKLSEGFAVWWADVALVFFYLISFGCLTMSLRSLELSIAYAVWSGLGTALIAFIGFWLFGEDMNWLKFVSLGLIIAGVAGLKMAGAS